MDRIHLNHLVEILDKLETFVKFVHEIQVHLKGKLIKIKLQKSKLKCILHTLSKCALFPLF